MTKTPERAPFARKLLPLSEDGKSSVNHRAEYLTPERVETLMNYIPDMEARIRDLERSVNQWKGLSSYLASCHAATLEGLPKRAAKSERARMVRICLNSAEWLRGNGCPRPLYNDGNQSQIESDIKRCEDAAKNHAN